MSKNINKAGTAIVKESRIFVWFFFAAIVLCAYVSAAAQVTPTPTPGENPQSEENLVHFGDIIDVDFVGGFEYDWRGPLTSEGYLAGVDGFGNPIPALCRPVNDIADDVAKAYSKILRDPKIIVRIVDRSNRAAVRLEGAIRTPTRFKLQREVKLRELLILAGGFTDDASGEISIFRPGNLNCRQTSADNIASAAADNGSKAMTIKIIDLLRGDPEANIHILSGDLIDVSRALPVYVIGAVNSPRPVYSRSEITVSRAVASAGGLAKDADNGKVTIFSRKGIETTLVATDLRKIKRGESVDVVLKPFDIIDVAGKAGGKRKFPSDPASSTKTAIEKRELPLRVIE
ncbi:MAG: SLBB domain-containing protein [Pyrinomonadaceae bacterium]